MADLSMDTLLHPPFENDPPVKLNINAKILGLVYAIIAAVGFLFALIGLLFGGLAAVFGIIGGNPLAILHLVSSVINIVAEVAVAWGGYQMYQENPAGKRLVIFGLAGFVLAAVVGALGTPNPIAIVFGLIGAVITAAIVGVFYYLVVISRFPNEAPLVAGGGMPGGGMPGGGFGSPPPPPPA